jgi:RND superfamily putative drug exporter
LIDQSFMDGMALASIFAVVAVLLGTLTLLPAAFGFTGDKIDGLGTRGLGRRKRSAVSRSSAEREVTGGFWYRWSRAVQRRPLPFAVVAVVLVGALAIPFFSMRLAFTDSGNDPSGSTTRQAFDLLARGFGPGFNGPLVLAVKRTVALVHRLRGQVIPGVTAGHDVTVLVGGETAASVDSATHLSSRLPLVVGLVILLSFILLAAVFRSIVIPKPIRPVNSPQSIRRLSAAACAAPPCV